MKKLIRLTESDLHRIIEGAVKRTINEIGDTYRGQYMLGRLAGRKYRDNFTPQGYEDMQKVDNYRDAQGRSNLGDYYGNYNHSAHMDGYNDEFAHRNPKTNYERYKQLDNQ